MSQSFLYSDDGNFDGNIGRVKKLGVVAGKDWKYSDSHEIFLLAPHRDEAGIGYYPNPNIIPEIHAFA